MDEINLFEALQPPPPPDAPRMREAARARLAAATAAPPAHPVWRRGTVVSVAATAALVAAGSGYALTAVQGGASPQAHGTKTQPATVAGLTAMRGCRGMYMTAGTLKQVNGTQLVLQPANDFDHQNRDWRAQPVTVDTTAATAITRPASGTVSDITDGDQVVVQGSWVGDKLAATEVGIETNLPRPTLPHFGPPMPAHVRSFPRLAGLMGPPIAMGTVEDAHDGSFTVVMHRLFPGAPTRIDVTTSSSTKVRTRVSSTLSQLKIGANVVAVGQPGSHGVLTASTVSQPSVVEIMLAGGPVKVRASSCSASALTTAAVLTAG